MSKQKAHDKQDELIEKIEREAGVKLKINETDGTIYCPESISLKDADIRQLPVNLEVNGYLDLRYADIK